jgi:hypothetical protein
MTRGCIPAAKLPEAFQNVAPNLQRAQGMPDARRIRSLVCKE